MIRSHSNKRRKSGYSPRRSRFFADNQHPINQNEGCHHFKYCIRRYANIHVYEDAHHSAYQSAPVKESVFAWREHADFVPDDHIVEALKEAPKQGCDQIPDNIGRELSGCSSFFSFPAFFAKNTASSKPTAIHGSAARRKRSFVI